MKSETPQIKTVSPEVFNLTDKAALALLKVLLSYDKNVEAQKEKEREASQ